MFQEGVVATVLERLSLRFGNMEASDDLEKRNFKGRLSGCMMKTKIRLIGWRKHVK